ncbi:hypothetical protein EON65_07760 [archaeon]|nr:MAG: hypothetical protein EON65_07760 [archaeon]
MAEQESPVHPPFDATININEFLDAIASSKKISDGGVSSALKQAAMNINIPSPISPLQDADRLAYSQDEMIDFISVDNFFSSAQDEDGQASSPRPHSKRSTPANRQSVRKSFKFQEDFTVESLRRNWDKEEELSANIEKLTQKVLSPHRSHDPNDDDVSAGDVSRAHRSSEVETLNHIVQNRDSVGKRRDERVKNDFLVCSAGEKLNNAFIFSEYIGLYPTEITHYNNQGKLVPSPIPTSHSTSNAKNRLMSSLSHFDPAHHATSSMLSSNPSGAGCSSSNSAGSGSYYNVHLLECILRPDIELKSIMAVIVQFSKQFCCKLRVVNRSHMVLTPLVSSTDTNRGRSMSAGVGSKLDHSTEKFSLDKHEFDHLDIQICISKSIRQRVLLLQFARKVGSYGGLGFGSMLLTQLSGPLEYLTIKSCPETRAFMSRLRKELVAQEMSFSSLYTCSLVRVCALPQGLDSHFLAQLHSMCREQMWQKLDGEYKTMDEHVRQEEEEMTEFTKLMEPIYKYGVYTHLYVWNCITDVTEHHISFTIYYISYPSLFYIGNTTLSYLRRTV